jgi:hypothetical protein
MLDVEISSFGYESDLNLVKFTIETFNRGSISYRSRVKLDVLNTTMVGGEEKNKVLFTAWGKEEDLTPGSRMITQLYWHSDEVSDRKVRVRVYHADDILEEVYDIDKRETLSKAQSDVFKIKNFRTYDDYVLFDLTSNEFMGEVILIPKDFQTGWVFEQKILEDVPKGETLIVRLPYEHSMFTEEPVTIGVVGDGSNIYDEFTFKMERKTGLFRWIQELIDGIRLAVLQIA